MCSRTTKGLVSRLVYLVLLVLGLLLVLVLLLELLILMLLLLLKLLYPQLLLLHYLKLLLHGSVLLLWCCLRELLELDGLWVLHHLLQGHRAWTSH